MADQQVTFASTYPGAQITVAMLGAVEVGRIHTEGKRASWLCHLPPALAGQWHKARNVEDAKAALATRVERWIEEAGLTRKARTTDVQPAKRGDDTATATTGQHDDSTGAGNG